MYQTSENYKLKVYKPSTRHALKVFINDEEISSKYILDMKISHQLFTNDEFSLGSVTSQSVELKLYKTAVPENINKVYVETGVAGEAVPIGYFNVDEISKDDDYTVTLKLLDHMIKFETNYDGSTLNYPCMLKTVLQDICSKVGVELRFNFFFKYG